MGRFLGQGHDSASQALIADFFRHPEHLDEQPSIGCAADKAASDLAALVPRENPEWGIVARRNILAQCCKQAILDFLGMGLGIGLDREADMGERLDHRCPGCPSWPSPSWSNGRRGAQFICTSTTPGTARRAPAIWGVAMYLPGSLTSTSRSPSSRMSTRETSPSPLTFSRSKT